MMNSLKVSLALCAIAMCIVVVYGDKEKMMKCDGQDLKKPDSDNAKKEMEATKACFGKYAGTEGDMMEKMKKAGENACFGVCVLQAKGVLDDKGAFNKAKTEENAKNLYPTNELADAMIAGINTCAKDISLEDGKALSMDDNCKAYKAFNPCMVKKHMEVCKMSS